MSPEQTQEQAQELWAAVDRFITDTVVKPDAALESARKASDAGGLPQIAVAPNQGKLLMLLARGIGAKKILEIGTLGGYSTIWLARALPDGGKMITLEFEPKHAEVARGNLEHAGLSDRVQVRVGRAIDSLPKLEAERTGPFDLIFIDADKEGYPDYWAWALKLSRPGTWIIADNVVRDGEVINTKSDDARVQAVRRYLEIMAKEPRVSGTVIQTVGAKSYDGLAFTVVQR
jgi:predicted O-methyltransferase YrrM